MADAAQDALTVQGVRARIDAEPPEVRAQVDECVGVLRLWLQAQGDYARLAMALVAAEERITVLRG